MEALIMEALFPCSIWLLPCEQDDTYLQEIIDRLRQQYQAPYFRAHLTLFAAPIPPAQIKEASQKANDIARGMQRIELVTGPVQTSDKLFKALFIECLNNERLDSLYQQCKEVFAPSGEYRLMPHVSLLYQVLPIPEREKIRASLTIKPALSFDRLGLVIHNHDSYGKDIEKWQVKILGT